MKIKKVRDIKCGSKVRKLNNTRIYILDKKNMLLLHDKEQAALLLDEELEVV